MADAAARREARRRRILDNSENRLQRITGSKNSVQEGKPDIFKLISSFILHVRSRTMLNVYKHYY